MAESKLSDEAAISDPNPAIQALKEYLPSAIVNGVSKEYLKDAVARLFHLDSQVAGAVDLSNAMITNNKKAATEFIKEAIRSQVDSDKRQLAVDNSMLGWRATMEGTLQDASLGAEAAAQAAAIAKAAAPETEMGNLIEGSVAHAKDAAFQAKNRV